MVAASSVKFPAITAVNGKLYLSGGQDQFGSPSNSLSVFDPSTKLWKPLAPMPTRRYSAAAVALNGLVYVMGGYNGSAPVASTEVYNPTTNSWRTVTGMSNGSSSPGAGAVGGKIYLAGGGADTTLATNQAYTP